MSKNTSTQALRRSPAAGQAAPKRVRQASTLQTFGSWWDLRYPVRAK